MKQPIESLVWGPTFLAFAHGTLPMTHPPPQDPHGDTSSRLMDAAATVFADRGLREATVRDICALAGANVAAIHYHFGSKEELYLATLRRALRQHFDAHPLPSLAPLDPEVDPAGARAQLEAVVRGIGQGILGPAPEWHTRLLLRCLLEADFALPTVLEEFLGPRFGVLRGVLAVHLPGKDAQVVVRHALSVVAQLVFYRAFPGVALHFLGATELTPELRAAAVDHVVTSTRRVLEAARRAP